MKVTQGAPAWSDRDAWWHRVEAHRQVVVSVAGQLLVNDLSPGDIIRHENLPCRFIFGKSRGCMSPAYLNWQEDGVAYRYETPSGVFFSLWSSRFVTLVRATLSESKATYTVASARGSVAHALERMAHADQDFDIALMRRDVCPACHVN